jgi:hypothetical protein
MKFLRNPIVTGILAVVAVVVVLYQVMGSNIHLHLGGTAARVVQTIAPSLVPPPPPPVQTNQVVESNSMPDVTIDRGYLEARFAKWVTSPLRDPFLLFASDKEKLKEDVEFASPISKWKLSGIWDQTGGKLAVINKSVHRIGDEIEGYKIVKIEGGEVWFQGPKRRERLALESRGPAYVPNPIFLPATNNVPSNTVPE